MNEKKITVVDGQGLTTTLTEEEIIKLIDAYLAKTNAEIKTQFWWVDVPNYKVESVTDNIIQSDKNPNRILVTVWISSDDNQSQPAEVEIDVVKHTVIMIYSKNQIVK